MSRPADIAPLTGLRGAAAVCVILYHYTYEGGLGPPLARRVLGHGYLSVDVFFVLSGFVMALVHGEEFRIGAFWPTYRRFIVKRVARIYPLYIVMTLVCVIVACSGFNDMWRQPGEGPGWVMRNVLLLQGLGGGLSIDLPAWSISTELAAYAVFPALCALCLYCGPPRAGLIAAICIAAFAGLSIIPPTWVPAGTRVGRSAWLDISDCTTLYPMLRCLAGFTLGVLTWRAFAGAPGHWLRGRTWPATAVAAAIAVLLCFRGVDVLTVSLFAPLILCLAADRSAAARLLALPPFTFLGVISYSLYLVHTPVRDVMETLIPVQSGSRLLVICSECLVTLAIACVTYRLVERPGRRLALQLFASAPGRIAGARSG